MVANSFYSLNTAKSAGSNTSMQCGEKVSSNGRGYIQRKPKQSSGEEKDLVASRLIALVILVSLLCAE
jgi:hypothetical protein